MTSNIAAPQPDNVDDDLMNIGGSAFSPALGPPVLGVAPKEKSSTVTKAAIGVGGAVFLAMAATVVYFFVLTPQDSVPSDQDERVAKLLKQLEDQKKGKGNKEEIEKLQQEIADEQQDTKEDKSGSAKKSASSSKKSKSKARSVAPRKKGGKSAKKKSSADKQDPFLAGGGGDSEKKVEKKVEKEEKKPTKGGNSELDDLLGPGGGSKPKKKKSSSSSSSSSGGGSSGSDLPQKLSRAQVKSGMASVAGAVRGCGQGESGTVTVKVVIAPSGKVASANTTGVFAGSAPGRCAASAVRRAKFPATQNKLTVTYPFKF